MLTWDQIKKIDFRKMKKDPAWRAERMAFVKPSPKHLRVPPTAKELREQRNSTKRQRAKAQSLTDRGL